MTHSVTGFLRGLSAKPFVVQFVTALTVGDNEEPVTQITSYLISAGSESEARAVAQGMIESLSDSYRNSDGNAVAARCIGIHSVDELDYVDDDGRLELGVVLQTGARWKDLPERYPSPATCWRRLQEWTQAGIWVAAWRRLLGKLDHLRQIDWEEAMGDGTFSPGKKGAPRSATPRKARAPRSCCSSTATARRSRRSPPPRTTRR